MIPVSRPQKEFIFSEHPHPAMIGGLGCVHPSTKIYTEYGLMRICDINRPMRVLSWNQKDQRFQLSLCGGAYRKQTGNLYQVATLQRECVVAGNHRIFSSENKYLRADHLNYKDSLLIRLSCLEKKISESCLKLLLSNAQNYSKTDEDYLGDYANEARRYGQQLHWEEYTYRSFVQGQVYAQELSRFYVDADDSLEHEQAHRLRHLIASHIHNVENFCLSIGSKVEVEEDLILKLCSQHKNWELDNQVLWSLVAEFQMMTSPHRIESEEYQRVVERTQACGSFSWLNASIMVEDTIITVFKIKGNFEHYDMQVLDTNNYICENGFIHHNSGKSQAGTYRLVKLLLEEKGLNVSHFFPSYRLAKRRGLPGVCEHLKNEYGLKYLINKSDLTVYVPEVNGTIYLESYHDPNSIVAYAIAHGVTDELDTLPKEQAAYVWQKITERVRQKCKRGNTLACVSTPDQGVNGFCYQKWGDGQHIDKGYHYIKAGTNSNKFLPEGYADQISKNYDPITAEAFLNGGWVSFTQNKVYHFFDRKKHHTARVIGTNDSVIHIGIDFNIGGCCANVFIVENNNPVAVDEFVSYDTRDFISNLAAKYRGKTCIIYPDASGAARKTNASQSDIELIKNAGYQVKVNHSNPAIRDRINIFNGLLAHDRLKINTDKCPLLTNALETQGYDKNGDPEKFDNHPAIDDFVDNSGYFLAYAFPIIRPVTQIRVGGGL